MFRGFTNSRFYLGLEPLSIILRLGVVDRYLNFKLNDQTSVYKSCTATMNGDTYVFGGHFDDGEKSNTKQVSHPKSANRR